MKKTKCFLDNITKMIITTNKNFWAFIKPFLSNKRFLENKDITLIEGNKIINRERKFSKGHYTKIVEKIDGVKPLTKIRIFRKEFGKLSIPTRAILVYQR